MENFKRKANNHDYTIHQSLSKHQEIVKFFFTVSEFFTLVNAFLINEIFMFKFLNIIRLFKSLRLLTITRINCDFLYIFHRKFVVVYILDFLDLVKGTRHSKKLHGKRTTHNIQHTDMATTRLNRPRANSVKMVE